MFISKNSGTPINLIVLTDVKSLPGTLWKGKIEFWFGWTCRVDKVSLLISSRCLNVSWHLDVKTPHKQVRSCYFTLEKKQCLHIRVVLSKYWRWLRQKALPTIKVRPWKSFGNKLKFASIHFDNSDLRPGLLCGLPGGGGYWGGLCQRVAGADHPGEESNTGKRIYS